MAYIVKNVVHWGSSHTRTKTPAIDLCEACNKKPKFVDKDGTHPYCSRTCARSVSGTSPAACILRGCRATGKAAFSNFCSEVHAREGVRLGQVEGCELCFVEPCTIGTTCIPCDRLVRTGPRLRELKSDGSTFKNLRTQFLSEWDGPEGKPRLEKIYEIILSRETKLHHEQYRQTNSGLQEVRSFHSSQCICDLGTKGSALCSFKSCGICCIVKSSFKSFAFEEPFNSGRFGQGIYSYRNPALADQFATSCTSSPYRVMIACNTSVESGQCDTGSEPEEVSLFVPYANGILPVYVYMYTK